MVFTQPQCCEAVRDARAVGMRAIALWNKSNGRELEITHREA